MSNSDNNKVYFTNGFPSYYKEIKDKRNRLEKVLTWWLSVHYHNTGYTENNKRIIIREIFDIFEEKE